MREIKFTATLEGKDYAVSTVGKPRDNRGSHNFKGFQMRHGYVARLVNNHPLADSRGYVLEHRLVMEAMLGRFLMADEVVHHKNNIRDDNASTNLILMTDQKRHAAGHAVSMQRDKESKRWLPDPVLGSKKFRLLNKNTGLMEIKNLSELINTTYRRSQFEYRGQNTGLTDKNGAEIYEGDIVSLDEYEDVCVPVVFHNGMFCVKGFNWWHGSSEVIGNIYENPELIK